MGLHGEHSDAQMDDALGHVGLTGQRDLFAFSLSAGQRRRLALCRTLLCGAPLWLLDEPMANLDAAGRDWCAGQIERHVQGGGLVIMTDHRDLSLGGDSYRKLEMAA